MLSTFKKFLEKTLTGTESANALPVEKQLQIATAALFVEMTGADFEVLPEEKKSVESSLREAFQLSTHEISQVMALASEKIEQTVCLHQFTQLINKNYTQAQKYQVIKLLWRVAYADGHLDKYEEHLIRRVADLVSISHSEMIKAKHEEKPK